MDLSGSWRLKVSCPKAGALDNPQDFFLILLLAQWLLSSGFPKPNQERNRWPRLGSGLLASLAFFTGLFPSLSRYPSHFSISEFPPSCFLRLLCCLRVSFRPFRVCGRSPRLLPCPLYGRSASASLRCDEASDCFAV
jgi:hypothetical protein